MKKFQLLVILLISTYSFSQKKQQNSAITKNVTIENSSNIEFKKIPILNFGTFHMGETADLNKTEFDENDKKNQLSVKEIAAKLALFRPTVIIVETPPSYDKKLQAEYTDFIVNPKMVFKDPSEIELLAYEIGRISGTKQIYGIDHKMGYNYLIGDEIVNAIDSVWYTKYYKNPLEFHPEVNIKQDNLSLLDKLKLTNHNEYLDFLIAVNADMLSTAGTVNGFEGADEAAKYYQRNLRMYSNLNRLNLTTNDRVFIIMGASHTAFFRDFISRSPKYKMVNTFDYLK
jgi:hypothetical protein